MTHQFSLSRRAFVGDIASAVAAVAIGPAEEAISRAESHMTQSRLDGPDLKVAARQRVELTITNDRASHGKLQFVRPKTAAALKTLFSVPTRRPARLENSQMFEVSDTLRGGTLLKIDGEAGGMSSYELRVLVHALPTSGEMPTRVPITIGRMPGTAVRQRRRRVIPEPGTNPRELERLGWVLKTSQIAVPPLLRNFQIVARVLTFGDVEIGESGVLVIGSMVTTMNLVNLTMHQNARVLQQSPMLVVNSTGEFKGDSP